MRIKVIIVCFLAVLLSACGTLPGSRDGAGMRERLANSARGNEVALYALGLVETPYRFGGKEPAGGFDCSGMVAYVFGHAVGFRISGNAADIAHHGQAVSRQQLHPGDLIFFNTLNRPLSHVGIYIGGERFVHAPSSNGKVRIDRLDNSYYAERYDMARAYFD